jgi:phosphatidate cytidylyltransferase
MKTRVISGAVYVAIVVGMFCLRQFVDTRLFQLLTYFYSIVGTFEVARAVKDYAVNKVVLVAIIYSVLFAPLYALFTYLNILDLSAYLILLTYFIGFALILCLMANAQRKTLKEYGVRLIPLVYPMVFILCMLAINDLSNNSFVAMSLLYVIAPIADTMAYFVGSMIGGKKLCPKLSPKKTWSGAIGGVIGGIGGAILVYAIFKPTISLGLPYLVFAGIGLIASILTIFGDLLESLLKRKVNIKDMGKIMPGHGGVMDRIDGMTLLAPFILLIFSLI